jgi:hypothetical protein
MREAAKHGAANDGEEKYEAAKKAEAKNGAVNYRPVKLGAENTSKEECTWWNRKQRSGDHEAAKHGAAKHSAEAWSSEAWRSDICRCEGQSSRAAMSGGHGRMEQQR